MTPQKYRKNRLLNALLISAVSMVLFVFAGCGGEGEAQKDASAAGYAKLQALRVHEDSLLTKYRLIDASGGIYRIPVSRALELVAAENTAAKGSK